MRTQPDPFTIVLCTYNGLNHLEAQLRTLRVQAGVAEIVVSDDASTDGTMNLLRRHAAEDPRIRLGRNRRTLGVTANFAQALSRVRTSWIALSDQDDLWLPDKLARLQAAWDGQACLLHHATHKFRRAVPSALPSPAGERRKFSGSDVRRLLYRNSIVGHTLLVRTDIARRLAPFPGGVPHDWWLGAGAAALGRVQYVDEYLVHYRIHAGNAFHAVGSRWRRARTEHGLRLAMLQALAGWEGLSEAPAGFVRAYHGLLAQTQPGTFPWALWRFYLRQADLLFGGGTPLSPVRRLRKSCAAALGAMWRVSPAAGGLLRPALPVPAPAGQVLRRTG